MVYYLKLTQMNEFLSQQLSEENMYQIFKEYMIDRFTDKFYDELDKDHGIVNGTTLENILKEETFMQLQKFYEKKIVSGDIRVENMEEFYNKIKKNLDYHSALYLERRITFAYSERQQKVVQYVNLWGGNPDTVHVSYMGGYNHNRTCVIISLQDLFAYYVHPTYKRDLNYLIEKYKEERKS